MASKTLDIVLRALGQDQVKSALAGVGDAAKKTGEDVSKAGADSANSFDGAGASAVSLTEKLEGVRDTAVKVGAAGGALLALGESLSANFVEADRLSAKMESLLSAKGMSGASAAIKQLASDLSDVTGKDDDELGAQIAASVASGRVSSLRELGIAISEQGQASIDAAAKVSDHAKAQETLNQVLIAGAAAVGQMKANLDPATVAAGEFSKDWGNLVESLGAGAARSRAAILGGLVSPTVDFLKLHPDLAATAGSIVEIGGVAVTSGASLVGFAAQALIVAEKLGILGFAKAADVAASGRVAIASGISAAAITTEGNAALVASGKLAALGRAKMLAGGVAKVAGVATAGILAGAAIYDATRGDKPSAGQITGYYYNRLRGDNPNDAATRAMGFDPNAKGDAAEKESLRLTEAAKARRAAGYGPLRWETDTDGVRRQYSSPIPAPATSPLTAAAPDAPERLSPTTALQQMMRASSPNDPRQKQWREQLKQWREQLSKAKPAPPMEGLDMGAQALQMLQRGAQIGGGLNFDRGAVKGGNASGGNASREIPLRLRNGGTKQNANGGYKFKIIADEVEVEIPYQGIAGLSGF